jgi:hypothetical protein
MLIGLNERASNVKGNVPTRFDAESKSVTIDALQGEADGTHDMRRNRIL